MISELHTSDLTASCMKAVQLRHEGKIIASGTEALFKGQLFGECCRYIHERDEWRHAAMPGLLLDASKAVADQLAKENRPLSDAVVGKRALIESEVLQCVEAYAARKHEHFGTGCKLIGCELPIRMDLAGFDGGFASHLDLLYRRNGKLVVRDWKFRSESPTSAYLGRNLQLACYWLACYMGSVKIGDTWVEFEEFPIVEWFDGMGLKPYKRAVTFTDFETGEETKYAAGSARPIEKIVRPVVFQPEQAGALTDELSVRSVMISGGVFPTNPDPVGCFVCESNRWCPRFDEVQE